MSGPGVVRGLRALGRASLTLLAALLPFEMTDPLLGGMVVALGRPSAEAAG